MEQAVVHVLIHTLCPPFLKLPSCERWFPSTQDIYSMARYNRHHRRTQLPVGSEAYKPQAKMQLDLYMIFLGSEKSTRHTSRVFVPRLLLEN